MEKRKRRCFFKLKRDGQQQAGWFHEWGFDVIEATDSINNYSVAIIEDDLGQVHLVYPEFITFK